MPVVEALPLGMPWTMKANVVYALPAVNAYLFTDAATPTIQQSDDYAFTTNVALTLTNGAAQVLGGWIRATADTLVILKRA